MLRETILEEGFLDIIHVRTSSVGLSPTVIAFLRFGAFSSSESLLDESALAIFSFRSFNSLAISCKKMALELVVPSTRE